MTISLSQEIDEKAQNHFRSSLPASWLKREQKPDHYIDYFIEIGEVSSEPSGTKFGVQLRGTASPKYAKDFIIKQMGTKHLIYYIDNIDKPVFLVVVDVNQQKGFWLFMQEWVTMHLKGQDWRRQTTVTVKIPLENRLEDSTTLERAVLEAGQYMRDLWPSSIEASVAAEEKQLKALDSRFDVNISFSGRTIFCDLLPREDIDLVLRSKDEGSPIFQNKLDDLVNRGMRIEFSPDQIEIHGSELFKHISQNPAVQLIEISPIGLDAEVILNSRSSSESEQLSIPGAVTVGRKEANFEGSFRNSPLKVGLRFSQEDLAKNRPLEITFDCDPAAWEGLPLLRLPYFDRLIRFFRSIRNGNSVQLELEIKGEIVFSAHSTTTDIPFSYLEFIEKARIVAQRVDINPAVPRSDSISREEARTIDLLYQVITNGEQRLEGSKVRFSGRLPNEKLLEMADQDNYVAFGFCPDNHPFELFGTAFFIDWLRYDLTKGELILDKSARRMTKKQILQDGIEFECRGVEGAEIIISAGRNHRNLGEGRRHEY